MSRRVRNIQQNDYDAELSNSHRSSNQQRQQIDYDDDDVVSNNTNRTNNTARSAKSSRSKTHDGEQEVTSNDRYRQVPDSQVNSRSSNRGVTTRGQGHQDSTRQRRQPPTAQQLSYENDTNSEYGGEDGRQEQQQQQRRGGGGPRNERGGRARGDSDFDALSSRQSSTKANSVVTDGYGRQQKSKRGGTAQQGGGDDNNYFSRADPYDTNGTDVDNKSNTQRGNGVLDNNTNGDGDYATDDTQPTNRSSRGGNAASSPHPRPVGVSRLGQKKEAQKPKKHNNNDDEHHDDDGETDDGDDDPFEGHEALEEDTAARRSEMNSNSSEGCNGRLYDLLQTDPEVPAGEIKTIFGRTRLRAQYREAYCLLSSSDKKRLYDIVGEPIVDALNKSWGDVVEVLGSACSIVIFGFGMFSTMLLLLLFTVFLPVKIDGRTTFDWSWHGVMSPLYVLFALATLGCIFLCLLSRIAPSQSLKSVLAFRHPLGRLLCAVGYLAFVVAVGVALNDDKKPSKWVNYFIILIVVDCLTILEWMSWVYPQRMRRLFDSYVVDNPNNNASKKGGKANNNNNNGSFNDDGGKGAARSAARVAGDARQSQQGVYYSWLVYGFMIIGVIDFILAIVRYVFIGLKCDGDITFSWYGVVAPIAIRLLTAVLYRFHANCVMHFIGQRTTYHLFTGLLGSLMIYAFPFITTWLIAGYLEKEGGYDLVYAFIPLYFVVAYFAIAMVFTTIYLFRKNSDFVALEEHEALQLQLRRGEAGASERDLQTVVGHDDDGEMHAEVGDDGDGHPKARKARFGANGEPLVDEHMYEAASDDDGSSSGDELCLSDATHISQEEEDHHPFGGGGHNNTTIVSASTVNRTQQDLTNEPVVY